MLKNSIISGILFYITLTANAYDLINAMENAHQQNLEIKLNKYQALLAQNTKQKNLYSLTPDVSIITNKDNNSIKHSFRIKQKIFEWGKTLHSLDKSNINIQETEFQQESVDNKILYETAENYYSTIYYFLLAELSTQLMSTLEQKLSELKQADNTSKYLNNVLIEESAIKNSYLEKAYSLLSKLEFITSNKINHSSLNTSGVSLKWKTPISYHYLKKQQNDVNSNSEVKVKVRQLNKLYATKKESAADMMPKLSFEFEHSQNRTKISSQNKSDNKVMLSLEASLPFSGGAFSHNKEIDIETSKAKIALSLKRAEISSQLKQLLPSYKFTELNIQKLFKDHDDIEQKLLKNKIKKGSIDLSDIELTIKRNSNLKQYYKYLIDLELIRIKYLYLTNQISQYKNFINN